MKFSTTFSAMASIFTAELEGRVTVNSLRSRNVSVKREREAEMGAVGEGGGGGKHL